MKTLHKRQRTLFSALVTGTVSPYFQLGIFSSFFPVHSGHGFVFECFKIHEIIHICEKLLFLPSTYSIYCIFDVIGRHFSPVFRIRMGLHSIGPLVSDLAI